MEYQILNLFSLKSLSKIKNKHNLIERQNKRKENDLKMRYNNI